MFGDDFDRADNAVVDAVDWQELPAAGNWAIVSNKVRCTNSGNLTTLLATTAAHAAVADVRVTVEHATTTRDGGPVARWPAGGAGGTSNGYAADAFSDRLELFRYNNSSVGTLLGSGIDVTLVTDGLVGLEVTGSDPVVVKSYYEGIVKESVNDTSGSRITTANRTGIHDWSGSGITADYDNFFAEDLSGQSPAVESSYKKFPKARMVQ